MDIEYNLESAITALKDHLKDLRGSKPDLFMMYKELYLLHVRRPLNIDILGQGGINKGVIQIAPVPDNLQNCRIAFILGLARIDATSAGRAFRESKGKGVLDALLAEEIPLDEIVLLLRAALKDSTESIVRIEQAKSFIFNAKRLGSLLDLSESDNKIYQQLFSAFQLMAKDDVNRFNLTLLTGNSFGPQPGSVRG